MGPWSFAGEAEQGILELDRVDNFWAKMSNNTKLVNRHKEIMKWLEGVHGVESMSVVFGTC